MITTDATLQRHQALSWYQKNRARTAEIFELLTDEAYYEQPISLRHPIVFYAGHLPAFSLNTLVKKAHGKRGVDERLERLFARGIDPDEAAGSSQRFSWPSRDEVQAFVQAADALVIDALTHDPLEIPGHPLLDGADAVYTILEHEAMHQETLLYMWHRLPHALKRAPASYDVVLEGPSLVARDIRFDGGDVRLGVPRGSIPFGWDNEFGHERTTVRPFTLATLNVTNEEFLEFVEAGGYARPELWTREDFAWVREHGLTHPTFWESRDGQWQWRGMFENVPLPPRWPVFVSQAEAGAYAKWRGRRLPTEAEYQVAATPFPIGGCYDFSSWDPRPVGSCPDAGTARGVEDLVGNGWEWTSTVFAPFPGFEASASYPEYSSDFFDGSHYVLKGASTATAKELVRPTFRNWFRPRYPYVYATFRLAGDAS